MSACPDQEKVHHPFSQAKVQHQQTKSDSQFLLEPSTSKVVAVLVLRTSSRGTRFNMTTVGLTSKVPPVPSFPEVKLPLNADTQW